MSSIGSAGSTLWQTSLLQAAGRGDESKIRELLQEGIYHADKYKPALQLALQKVAGRGHESLTRLLLAEGAEVNATAGEVSPLYRAAESGKDHIVAALLEYGADTEARDKNRRTAIFLAAQKNHCGALRILLAAGANVNVRDVNSQNVLLFLAAEKTDKPVRWGEEIVRMILETNIDLEAKDREGRTALLWAATSGRVSLARLLLSERKGKLPCANIQAKNHRDKTALHLAAENNRIDLVGFLLKEGADPNAKSDGGWTALHNAATKGHANIASLLLEHKADVNIATSSGMTALHWCSRNGHLNVVEVLLRQPKTKRNIRDSFDTTAMLGAAENGHLDIVERLSPADDGDLLSESAEGACRGFKATIVDFGMETRPMNHITPSPSVYDVLYGWDDMRQKPLFTTLTRNVASRPKFRWIHLPTNNMSWVETLVTKHFVENRARDVEGFRLLEKSFVQLHRGPTLHSHFMRPLCQRMPPTGSHSSLSEATDDSQKEISDHPAPSTPLLEITPPQEVVTPTRAAEKRKTDKKIEKRGGKEVETPEKSKDSPQSSGAKRQGKNPRPEASPHGRRGGRRPPPRNRPSTNRAPRKMEQSGKIVLYMPYLHYEFHEQRKEMSDVIKRTLSKPDQACKGRTSDELLIQAYLQSSHNLQIRRTLDQFYYHAISTEHRDVDQVVYRYTKKKNKDVKVFMVDQLWMWIISDDLIITSFPQRWKQPKNDPLNVLDGIIEDMSSKTRPPVKSVHDLAVLITARCSGVFDRHRIGDEDYQFLDMFESSIGEVTNQETELFKRFNTASSHAAQWLKSHRRGGRRSKSLADLSSADVNEDDDDSAPNADPFFVDTLLDIGAETALLAETKDIRDELNMISLVLKHQLTILDDLTNSLLAELKGRQDRQQEIKRRFRELSKVVEVHIKDVERMDKQAEGIYGSLAHLLDLKQKHANAFEARFARDQAAFTGRQGQTIMVFTIVTVIFLPMSFIAAVFAIPVTEFPHRDSDGSLSIPLSYVSKFVFGVGLAISIPLIAVAFTVDDLGTMIRRSLQRAGNLGRRRRAKASPYSVTRVVDEQLSITLRPTAAAGPGGLGAFGRRSGDSLKRPIISTRSYTSSDEKTVPASPIIPPSGVRRRSLMGDLPRPTSEELRRWKDEPEWNQGDAARRQRGRGSRDLETGNAGVG